MKERAEYRLRYPVLARPRVRLDAGEVALDARVIDLSESAMLVELPAGVRLAVDLALSGRCRLLQGRDLAFSALCLRATEFEAALLFDRGSRVPINVMFEEQRTVRARFPEWR